MEADMRQEFVFPAQPSHPELGPHFSCRLASHHPQESVALACKNIRFSCLENPMDRGAWWATVHGVAKELDTI